MVTIKLQSVHWNKLLMCVLVHHVQYLFYFMFYIKLLSTRCIGGQWGPAGSLFVLGCV